MPLINHFNLEQKMILLLVIMFASILFMIGVTNIDNPNYSETYSDCHCYESGGKYYVEFVDSYRIVRECVAESERECIARAAGCYKHAISDEVCPASEPRSKVAIFIAIIGFVCFAVPIIVTFG